MLALERRPSITPKPRSPGVSAQQLAGHVTNWNAPTRNDFTPAGYTLRGQDTIYTRDGFVGPGCSQGK